MLLWRALTSREVGRKRSTDFSRESKPALSRGPDARAVRIHATKKDVDLMEKITIIVPTYNRSAILKMCIESLLKQTHKNWELFVVDDCSRDDTESAVRSFLNDTRIHYVQNSRNLGMSDTRENAVRECKTELLFIGEDDFILGAECLEILAQTFADLTKKFMCVFHVAPSFIDISEDRWNKSAFQLLHHFLPQTSNRVYRQNVYSQFKINIFTGYPHVKYGGLFTEAPILPSAGLYDSYLLKKLGFSKDYRGKPIFHEDDDLHFRARMNGFRLFYQPKAIAYHLRYPQGGERSFGVLRQQFFTLRNHFHFLVKFFGLKSLYMGPIFAISHLLYPVEVLMETTFSSFFIKDIETGKVR